MNEKTILCCEKCRYFPLKEEWQRYFLNSNTYKCPACQQLTMFDHYHKTLLDRQILYTQCQQDIDVDLSDQNARIAANQKEYENKKDNQSVTIIIWIQDFEEYLEGFYLNPINSRLKNESNINKQQGLSSQSHVFFRHNYEFTIQNMNNFINDSRLKLGLRRVNKIEHLLYYIDDYIQLCAEMLLNTKLSNQEEQKITNIKYQIWKLVKNSYYQLVKLVQFDHSTYTRMSSQTNIFHQQINTFYSQLYSSHFNCNPSTIIEESLTSFINTIRESKQIHLNSIALFSHRPNFHLLNEIQHLNSQKLLSTHLPIHHFYLIASQNNQHDSKTLSPYKSTSNPNITLEINHACLYEPLTPKRNTHDRMTNLIINSFEIFHNLQNAVANQQSTNQTKDSYALLFWTQTPNAQKKNDNSQNIINFIKIKSQSQQIFILLNQINRKIQPVSIQVTSKQKKNNQINEITSKLNNYTFKILQQTLPKIKHHQIILDRLICYSDGKKVFYVFDFDEKMKENFQQIDFLDEMALPQQLREYAHTYQTIKIKQENPFRKSNKIFLVVDSSTNENNFHNVYSDDSDQRESL